MLYYYKCEFGYHHNFVKANAFFLIINYGGLKNEYYFIRHRE